MTKPSFPAWVDAEVTRSPEAVARGLVSSAPHLQATAARFDARRKRIVVELANGTSFAFPPDLAQGLSDARPAELADVEITPAGTGLHWPRLDADLTVEGLLAGVFGSRAWMRQHAARAGSATSPAKAQAARANGTKGGRPRKAAA
jgi:hypothetical protein